MIELAAIGKPAFLGLGGNHTELAAPLFLFHHYMEMINSVSFVINHGENLYELPSLVRYHGEEVEMNEAMRKKLLLLFFQAGAIINTAPGERVLISYERGMYITYFEVVGRYSVAPVWIDQKDRKEFIDVDSLYDYVVAKFNYYN